MTIDSIGLCLLKSIKDAATSLGPQLLLRVDNPSRAYLRPLSTRKSKQNKEDVVFITNCRNKYPNSFLTEFKATVSQTSDWLANNVSEDNSRILFMVDLPDGQTIGYIGLAFIDWKRRYAEADSIVRGLPAPNGIMSASLRVLLNWARGQLNINVIGVRVIADNPALEFYRKFGFIEDKRVPLDKKIENGRIIWFEDKEKSNPERLIVYHTWRGI